MTYPDAVRITITATYHESYRTEYPQHDLHYLGKKTDWDKNKYYITNIVTPFK